MHPDDESKAFDFEETATPLEDFPGQDTDLRDRVMAALREVYDPEIPVNLVELGLIYELDVDAEGKAVIQMTLTTPSCPVAEGLPSEVEKAVRAVDGVTDAHVELVWTPIWHPGLMSEEAKLQLGML